MVAGCTYFKINSDDCMQLSGSDNKVNVYNDTTINGMLNSLRLSISNTTSRPLEINNTMHNGTCLMAVSKNIATSMCYAL